MEPETLKSVRDTTYVGLTVVNVEIFMYFSLLNDNAGWNNSAGWKIFKKLIIMQVGIKVQVGNFLEIDMHAV